MLLNRLNRWRKRKSSSDGSSSNKRKSKGKQKEKESVESNNGENSNRNSILLPENKPEESNDSLRDDGDKQINEPNNNVRLRNKGKQASDPERRYSQHVVCKIREKKNVTIGKLKDLIENLNERIIRLQDDCYEKDRQIKELEPIKESYQITLKTLKSKNGFLHREREKNLKLENDVKERETRIKELENDAKEREDRIEELEQFKNKVQDLHNEELERFENKVRDLQQIIDENGKRIKELEQATQDLQQMIKVRDERIEELVNKLGKLDQTDLKDLQEIQEIQEMLKKKDEEITRLRGKNKSLMDENSEHQNYIGKAISFSLSDDDKNHSVQLVKDIENLQTLIMDYVGNLRPRVDVNLEEVDKLSLEYGCRTRITTKDNNGLIKAIIQRYVFEKVLKEAENYFEGEQDKCSEHKIYEGTRCLLELMHEFSATRDGTNDIIQALPIKIRQQIYGLLGNLGFADVIENEEKHEHHFISTMKDALNKSVNNLRTIKDPKKKKKHDDMVVNLIREFIRIFWYRLNVQEPIAKYYWFSYNDKIDPNIMKGRWDNENGENDDEINDENNNNLFVEICSFPLIVANYGEIDQKIYTHAKVNHQVKRRNGCA